MDALVRLDGLPFVAEALADESSRTPGALGLGGLHAVHHFAADWAQGAQDAPVIDPTREWIATWTEHGLPAGVLRIGLSNGDPVLSGVVEDPHLAGALMGWDVQGQLVEEPDRGRWFALQGTTLLTLTGPSGVSLAGSYPLVDYRADLRDERVAGGAALATLRAPGAATLSALVGLTLLAGAGAAVVAAHRRVSARRRPHPPGTRHPVT